MTKKPSFDSQEFDENVYRVSKRILVLEKQDEREDTFLKTRDERLELVKIGFETQLGKIREELGVIKEKLELLDKNTNMVGKSLKIVAKKDQVERLKERIDEWPLEKFVKRDD